MSYVTKAIGLFLLVVLSITVSTAASAYTLPEACEIMTLNGLLPDTDCDGVHDAIDNCPTVPNAPQYDGNRDGIGDECDIIIEELYIKPTIHVRANEFFGLNVKIINNQASPIYGLNILVTNDDLQYDAVTDIPVMGAGEARDIEFLLKVPRCTPERSYVLTVQTRYMHEGSEHVQTDTQSIRVIPGGECDTPFTLLENTIVETFFDQEIDVGEQTVIPVRIVNLNEDAVQYDLHMTGFDSWATYRLDPSPSMVLASGHDMTLYLLIETEDFAEVGEHTVNMVVSADNEEESFPMTIRMRKPLTKDRGETIKKAFEVALILILFVVLLVGFIIAYKKLNDDDEHDDEEIEEKQKKADKILEEEGIEKADEPAEPKAKKDSKPKSDKSYY